MRISRDIVIVGLGAMGASAAYQLSKRNVRVVGLEQFKTGHVRGSSHGESRIVRQACYEHPSYAPLSLRSYQLLDELERRTGKPHSVRCGGLMIGLPNSAPVAGSMDTARRHNLAYEVLTAADIRRRFPALNVVDSHVAFFEAKAGAVFPETMVDSWIRMAGAAGVEVCEHHRVTGVEPHRGGVRVRGDGFVIDADQAIVTAGPWLDSLFPEMRAYLSVERIVQHWFEPRHPTLFAASAFPIFYWDVGPYQLYGFPSLDPGRKFVKVGLDNDRSPCRPDHVDRDVSTEELIRLDTALSTDIPDLQGCYVRSEPCLWTVSQDRNLIVGRHPEHEQIIIAGGCSGRGFKFSPVIGEILTQLALSGSTPHDIGRLSPSRIPAARAFTGVAG